jgi:hypothetical protein
MNANQLIDPKTVKELVDFVQQDQWQKVWNLLYGLKWEKGFAAVYLAKQRVTTESWNKLPQRLVRGKKDGVAGAIIVGGDLRMPDFPAFGRVTMPVGDKLTIYDHARTFILVQMKPGRTTRLPGNFYPELTGTTLSARVAELAEAHVGCQPGGQKQSNLFSCCGRFGYNAAKAGTKPKGTTCALFARAILVGAGDTQINEAKFPGAAQADVPLSIAPPSTRKSMQTSKAPFAPKRGDPYMIWLVEATRKDTSDSGHVGFIIDSTVTSTSIELTTVDGGQSGTGGGYYTTRNTRNFQLQSGAYPWVQTNPGPPASTNPNKFRRRLMFWRSLSG